MSIAYIAMGANLGNPLETFRKVVLLLAESPHFQSVRCSSFYRTQAIGMEGPDFMNAVLEVKTSLQPISLLELLQNLEQHFGRLANTHYQPRTLDLDILLLGDVVMQSEKLTLPHPRMHERAFVLHPLYEIAPHLTLPQGDWTELLSACQTQVIEKTPTNSL